MYKFFDIGAILYDNIKLIMFQKLEFCNILSFPLSQKDHIAVFKKYHLCAKKLHSTQQKNLANLKYHFFEIGLNLIK